jgi:hypothetical protein
MDAAMRFQAILEPDIVKYPVSLVRSLRYKARTSRHAVLLPG